MDRDLVPVTILTGFLGAGKTTLLKQILNEQHGQRIAVIENEFGEEGIDNELLTELQGEQIIEMNNGCICCTVRGDLVRILGELAEKRDCGKFEFDRVIIETTGLADPAPVAQTFFVEDSVAERYLLDAIITVVDAKHASQQLDEHHEAQEQVGFADRILLSKSDLVSKQEAVALKARLAGINPRAPIRPVHFGKTPLTEVLDIRGFDLNEILQVEPGFLAEDTHEHDNEVSSFVFRSDRPFDRSSMEQALGWFAQRFGNDLLRYKGVLYVKDEARRLVLQGVHMMMGGSVGRPWADGEKRQSLLVFIGRKLPKDTFEFLLHQSLA